MTAAAPTGIARAAACIVGIEYWQKSEWNQFKGYVNYFANAENYSSSNIKIQFLKVGGAQFGACYTVKPGQTKTLQSTGHFQRHAPLLIASAAEGAASLELGCVRWERLSPVVRFLEPGQLGGERPVHESSH